MEIVLNNNKSKYLEIFSLGDFDNINEIFKKFSSIKGPLEVTIFSINESISCYQFSKLKNHFNKINICSICLYSNNRNTILTGKSLGIDSTFVNEQEVKNKLLLLNTKKRDDILHEGTVRSGDRISSNGDLFIMGDVNPGAIISANNNVFVWGKLLGIAFAGKNGNQNASIASLCLNPLQLKICEIIAIGPKDKRRDQYPEIAVLEDKKIIIKPYLTSRNFK